MVEARDYNEENVEAARSVLMELTQRDRLRRDASERIQHLLGKLGIKCRRE